MNNIILTRDETIALIQYLQWRPYIEVYAMINLLILKLNMPEGESVFINHDGRTVQ